MGQLVRLLRLQLPAHHFHGDWKFLREGATQVTQLQTRYGMTGTVQTQERGGAGGAQPPVNCSHHIRYNFNAGCSAGSAPFFVICRITPYLFNVYFYFDPAGLCGVGEINPFRVAASHGVRGIPRPAPCPTAPGSLSLSLSSISSPSPSTGCSQGGILESKPQRQPSSRATV